MAYDSHRERVVLFGGAIGWTGNDETWEWDGTQWTLMIPKTTIPEARYWHAMAYDSKRQRTVMFGGRVDLWYCNKTWEWNGHDWTCDFPSETNPPARVGGPMCYDSHREKIVMFGGIGVHGYCTETWERDGIEWRKVDTGNRQPNPVAYFDMTYDKSRRRVLFFSGDDNLAWGALNYDTWEYRDTDPTPTPSPTPDPEFIETRLWMTDTFYQPSDICMCTVTVVNNSGQILDGYPLFVVLDVFGAYYFAPSFGTDLDTYLTAYPEFGTGETVVTVLPLFSWPDDCGVAAGASWYSGLADPDFTEIFAGWDSWIFGWGE